MKYKHPDLLDTVKYNPYNWEIIVSNPIINLQKLYTHSKDIWYYNPILMSVEFPFFQVDENTYILMYPWKIGFSSTSSIGYPNVEKYKGD